MLPRIPIPVEQLCLQPFPLFDKQWFLLTAGDFEANQYNTMTISWGGLGIMWNMPVVYVVVRPQRYTVEFMQKYPTFTLSAFAEEHRAALNLLGTKSGRDLDKIARSGLTPRAASKVAAPVFAEAELVFECRKLFAQDFVPESFVDAGLDKFYPRQDYHKFYIGEIVASSATPAYARKP